MPNSLKLLDHYFLNNAPLKKHVSRSLTMAVERAIYVVILCFSSLGSATVCSYDGECNQWSGESCCSDSVCRKNCYYCSLDSDCGTSEECCDGGDCSTFCSSSDSSSLTGAHTAGAIVGTMVFFAIVISCVACFCCTCCPYYRNRSPGTATDQQTLVSTTQLSAMSSEPVQHYPPSGPSPPNYSLPPPVTFNQPPSPDYNQPPLVTYS